MAFIAPLIATIGAAVPAASTLTAIGTGISAVSGILGVASSIQSSKFEESVLNQQADIAEDNRQRAITEGGINAQRADEAASQELGLLLATQSASGLSGGTHALQRKSLSELAARDRGTIVFESEVQGSRFAQKAQDARVQARQTSRARGLNTAGGILGIGGSLIGGASRFSELKRKELVA